MGELKQNEVHAKVDSVDSLRAKLKSVREAQEKFAKYTQEEVDKIFFAATKAANQARIPLAKLAVEETGMGVVEDKVIKNHFASEYIYNKYKDTQTCGVLEESTADGYKVVASPIGVVAAVIPTTNPTSTVIFKALISLKTRNGLIISPHPRAKESTIEAAQIILDAAVAAGAPEGIIGWIDVPKMELTNLLMAESDIILATGGLGMVKSAYSSGTPALGVGAGNVPALLTENSDVKLAVNSIVHSKTFDNGMICASEQSVIVPDSIYDEVKAEFIKNSCYFIKPEELEQVRKTIIINGSVNGKIVGQAAHVIAELAGIEVPKETKILIGEVDSVDFSEEFAHEKLSPVLAMYRSSSWEESISKAEALIEGGGLGHTSSVYLNERTEQDKLEVAEQRLKTARILVNTPSSQGGIGDIYNFRLDPSLTLGCGTWGGNSVSENVGVKHLLNVKKIAARRENMLWFRAPEKTYFKPASLRPAMEELAGPMKKKRAFIVTDEFLYNNGYTKEIEAVLNRYGCDYTVFADIQPDPTLSNVKSGVERMNSFQPDLIIAIGGGSPMDAAKIMWVLYEHPEVDFHELAMVFMDIRKRVVGFPKMGDKAYFVAIPTTAGTGSEVTPFAVITDDDGTKYPLADYELLPNMAIVDSNLMMNQPAGLTAASGFDAITHAIEAYVSTMASDFTNGIALEALRLMFDYLPAAYDSAVTGVPNALAREKTAYGASLAGLAFGNAFLGLVHSCSHKLGARTGIAHGTGNALMIEQVMRFNSSTSPSKMGTFPQYGYPQALERYAEIADALSLGGETLEEKFEALIQAIRDVQEAIGIKRGIKEYFADEEAFMGFVDEMSEEAFDDQCTGTNPRYPLIEQIKQIYINAYYGKSDTV